MTTKLRAEMERQLLECASYYGITGDDLRIDWSEAVPENHAMFLWDDWIEDESEIGIVTAQGERIAGGWTKWFYGYPDSLSVWWYLLYARTDGKPKQIVHDGLPLYQWERMPEDTKSLYAYSFRHDFATEDFVAKWLQEQESDPAWNGKLRRKYGASFWMGSELRTEVTRQLLADLKHYGMERDLRIDWSETAAGDHPLQLAGGLLDHWHLQGLDPKGPRLYVDGGIDFVYVDSDLYVWWDWLRFLDEDGLWRYIKSDFPEEWQEAFYRMEPSGLPLHLWERMTESAKQQYAMSGQHHNEKHVIEWKNQQPPNTEGG